MLVNVKVTGGLNTFMHYALEATSSCAALKYYNMKTQRSGSSKFIWGKTYGDKL